MPSSHAIIAASSDTALTQRLVAIAATLGAATPEYDAQRLCLELVIAPVDDSGATIASVYEYATVARAQAIAAQAAAVAQAEAEHPIPPEPGTDPAAVTDAHLVAALTALIDAKKINLTPATA